MTVSLFGFKAFGLKRQQYIWTLLLSLVKGSLLTLQRVFIIMLLAFACMYTMTLMQINHPVLGKIKTISLDLTVPLLEMINKPLVAIHHQYKKLRDFNQLQANYDYLKKENFQLEEWKSLAFKLKRENLNLRDLLRTLPSPDQSYFTAKVLGAPAGAEYSTLLIAATKDDGVKKNAVVVCATGVVGRIVDIGLLVSRVVLLTDINARTPVRFESTGEQAILAGAGTAELMLLHRKPLYETSLENKAKSASIKVGDRLVTSGFGGIYPPDLTVATVVRIEKDQDGDKIFAQLVAKPNALEFVRILDPLDPLEVQDGA
ncbi:MAG: rod shape-determining protein MreC [Candidatus Paracaedibacteraceae bacterium]|nr:rod shape-determining protein MreC [Candidatus Paracaedibacteraceae bacterium]